VRKYAEHRCHTADTKAHGRSKENNRRLQPFSSTCSNARLKRQPSVTISVTMMMIMMLMHVMMLMMKSKAIIIFLQQPIRWGDWFKLRVLPDERECAGGGGERSHWTAGSIFRTRLRRAIVTVEVNII
jgi:hypothetical protein